MKLLLIVLTCVTTAQAAYVTKNIQCDEWKHKGCLVWDNTTQDCYTDDCWKWDAIEEKCVGQKDFIAPIILQSIPVTGMFGSGFGNMGRWDIFGTYMCVVFLPLVVICCVACCMSMQSGSDSPSDTTELTKGLCCSCFAFVYALAVLILWIWGIVVIAEKNVKAPWVNAKGETVMCDLY